MLLEGHNKLLSLAKENSDLVKAKVALTNKVFECQQKSIQLHKMHHLQSGEIGKLNEMLEKERVELLGFKERSIHENLLDLSNEDINVGVIDNKSTNGNIFERRNYAPSEPYNIQFDDAVSGSIPFEENVSFRNYFV